MSGIKQTIYDHPSRGNVALARAMSMAEQQRLLDDAKAQPIPASAGRSASSDIDSIEHSGLSDV